MASKNLGAVIQRAISDGAFRRQLQSDPAAALRGFNLTPDEVAAVRSGDSGRLMSLGIDQRMSKAFTLGNAGSEPSMRAAVTDVTGSSSSVLTGDTAPSAREGLIGDPTSGARAAHGDGQIGGQVHASTTTPNGDAFRQVNDPDNAGGTRGTIIDSSAGTRSAISTGDQDSYRAVNDPDNAGGTRGTIIDSSAGTRSAISTGDHDSYRAVNDPDAGTLATHMNESNPDLTAASDALRDLGPNDSGTVIDGTGDAIGHTGDSADEHSWG
jgi:hypothetical protein